MEKSGCAIFLAGLVVVVSSDAATAGEEEEKEVEEEVDVEEDDDDEDDDDDDDDDDGAGGAGGSDDETDGSLKLCNSVIGAVSGMEADCSVSATLTTLHRLETQGKMSYALGCVSG